MKKINSITLNKIRQGDFTTTYGIAPTLVNDRPDEHRVIIILKHKDEVIIEVDKTLNLYNNPFTGYSSIIMLQALGTINNESRTFVWVRFFERETRAKELLIKQIDHLITRTQFNLYESLYPKEMLDKPTKED